MWFTTLIVTLDPCEPLQYVMIPHLSCNDMLGIISTLPKTLQFENYFVFIIYLLCSDV